MLYKPTVSLLTIGAVMKIVASDDKEMIFKQTKRNSLCPCGSGKKYKCCCGMRDDRKKSRGFGSDGIAC